MMKTLFSLYCLLCLSNIDGSLFKIKRRVSGPEKYLTDELNNFFRKSKGSEKLVIPVSSYAGMKSIRMNVTLDGRSFLECGEGVSYLPESAQPGQGKSRIVPLKQSRSLVAIPIVLRRIKFTLRKCKPVERKIIHWANPKDSVRLLNRHLAHDDDPRCPSSSRHFVNFVRVENKQLLCTKEFPDPIRGNVNVEVDKIRIIVRFYLKKNTSAALKKPLSYCIDAFSSVRMRQRRFKGRINGNLSYRLPQFRALYKTLRKRLNNFFLHGINKSKLSQSINLGKG